MYYIELESKMKYFYEFKISKHPYFDDRVEDYVYSTTVDPESDKVLCKKLTLQNGNTIEQSMSFEQYLAAVFHAFDNYFGWRMRSSEIVMLKSEMRNFYLALKLNDMSNASSAKILIPRIRDRTLTSRKITVEVLFNSALLECINAMSVVCTPSQKYKDYVKYSDIGVDKSE